MSENGTRWSLGWEVDRRVVHQRVESPGLALALQLIGFEKWLFHSDPRSLHLYSERAGLHTKKCTGRGSWQPPQSLLKVVLEGRGSLFFLSTDVSNRSTSELGGGGCKCKFLLYFTLLLFLFHQIPIPVARTMIGKWSQDSGAAPRPLSIDLHLSLLSKLSYPGNQDFHIPGQHSPWSWESRRACMA